VDQSYPSPELTITSPETTEPSSPSQAPKKQQPLDVIWRADNVGEFRFTEQSCSGNFKFENDLEVEFNATNR
jgi:hypothetical protein